MRVSRQIRPHAELRLRLDEVYDTILASPPLGDAHGDMPSLSEMRDILQLFVRVGDADVRAAVLDVLRTIAEPLN